MTFAFQGAAWSLVVGLVAAWFFFTHSQNFAVGLVPSVLALGSVLVPTIWKDFAQYFDPRQLIRSAFASTPGKWRGVVTVALCVAGVAAFAFDSLCARGLYVKDGYQQRVEESLSIDAPNFAPVARAILFYPWRREGFLSYERLSSQLKSDIPEWRRKTREFVTTPGLRDRIVADPEPLEWFVSVPAARPFDPVLALAHVYPEAESDDDTVYKKAALDLLARYRSSSPEARLLGLYTEYDLAELVEQGRVSAPAVAPHVRTRAHVIQALEAELERYADFTSFRSHEYLAGRDLVGYYAAATECDDRGAERAYQSFDYVLDARKKQLGSTEIDTWWRSPGKWRVFQLFRYMDSNGDAEQDSTWGRYFEGLAPLMACKPVANALRKLYAKYPDLHAAEKWFVGTTMQPANRMEILNE
jgi:hypothetical protein